MGFVLLSLTARFRYFRLTARDFLAVPRQAGAAEILSGDLQFQFGPGRALL